MIKQTETFPNTYKNYSTEKLIDAYSQGHKRLLTVIDDLSNEEMKTDLIPGKWTIYQILIHLTDSELMGYSRFAQTIAQSDRTFAFYDQDIWADKLNYSKYPVEELQNRLNLFASLRKSVVLILRSLTEDDWNKTGIHPELGEITLRNVLELYADHSERHIEQIIERRTLLNKPIELEKLLPVRLY